MLADFELKNGSYFLRTWQSNQYEGFAWNLPEHAGMGGKRAQVTGGGGVPQPTSKSGSMELPGRAKL